MTTNDLTLINLLYLRGKNLEIKRGTISLCNGVLDLSTADFTTELDCSNYIALPGFINVAMETKVYL